MGRPLRVHHPDTIHLLTVRTVESRLWISPCSAVRTVLLGILARYVELHGIQIFAYVFLGNHYHLLVRAPLDNLHLFAEDLNREITKRLNRFCKRQGPMWARRYDAQVTLEPADAVEALLYILTNPVKHGLVSNAAEWPGTGCLRQLLFEEELETTFVHYSRRDPLTRRPTKSRHLLRLSCLPALAKFSPKERRHVITRLVRKRSNLLACQRRTLGKGFLGSRALRTQRLGSRPLETKRTPRPACYTLRAQLHTEYRAFLNALNQTYRKCSQRFRNGDLLVEFPSGTFRPPMHRRALEDDASPGKGFPIESTNLQLSSA